MVNNEYIAIVDNNNDIHLTDTPIVRCRDCIFYDTVHLLTDILKEEIKKIS